MSFVSYLLQAGRLHCKKVSQVLTSIKKVKNKKLNLINCPGLEILCLRSPSGSVCDTEDTHSVAPRRVRGLMGP